MGFGSHYSFPSWMRRKGPFCFGGFPNLVNELCLLLSACPRIGPTEKTMQRRRFVLELYILNLNIDRDPI